MHGDLPEAIAQTNGRQGANDTAGPRGLVMPLSVSGIMAAGGTQWHRQPKAAVIQTTRKASEKGKSCPSYEKTVHKRNGPGVGEVHNLVLRCGLTQFQWPPHRMGRPYQLPALEGRDVTAKLDSGVTVK